MSDITKLNEESFSLFLCMDFCTECLDDIIDFKENDGQIEQILVKWKNGGKSWIKLENLLNLHRIFLRQQEKLDI